MKTIARDYQDTFTADCYIEKLSNGKYRVCAGDIGEPTSEEKAVKEWRELLNQWEAGYSRVYGKDNTALELTEKAEYFYQRTEPLTITETKHDGDYMYAMKGVIDRHGMSASDVNELLEELSQCSISIDNGRTFKSYNDITETEWKYIESHWAALTELMESDTREAVSNELAPCTRREFLKAYLEAAAENLIIG